MYCACSGVRCMCFPCGIVPQILCGKDCEWFVWCNWLCIGYVFMIQIGVGYWRRMNKSIVCAVIGMTGRLVWVMSIPMHVNHLSIGSDNRLWTGTKSTYEKQKRETRRHENCLHCHEHLSRSQSNSLNSSPMLHRKFWASTSRANRLDESWHHATLQTL